MVCDLGGYLPHAARLAAGVSGDVRVGETPGQGTFLERTRPQRSDDRSSKPASPRQAASSVSYSMSSASVSEPSIR